MNLSTILTAIPPGLKDPLIKEYNSIIQNYLERRWTASELSGGKFCEIVYTILDGYACGTYASAPSTPGNFPQACRNLERNTHVPRSFKILIPRMLPPLYEIRNNRSVGHAGGDVDSNFMDAQAVVAMCSWVLGELIRVYHNTSIPNAQKIVDSVTSRKVPLVWEIDNVKRVLKPEIKLKDQMLLLISSSASKTKVDDLFKWIENSTKKYFLSTLRKMHSDRLVEISADSTEVSILPPGSMQVERVLAKLI